MDENRRVKYTKMFLNESLLKFLADKPISRITVREICEDADVNRSTYYAHFIDPYDQLKQLEKKIIFDMTVWVDNILSHIDKDESSTYKFWKSILEYYEKNKQIFKVLLSDNGSVNFQRDILSFFAVRLFDNKEKETIKHYYYVYSSTGCLGIIYHWIMDETDTTAEDIAQIIMQFTKGI